MQSRERRLVALDEPVEVGLQACQPPPPDVLARLTQDRALSPHRLCPRLTMLLDRGAQPLGFGREALVLGLQLRQTLSHGLMSYQLGHVVRRGLRLARGLSALLRHSWQLGGNRLE